MPEHHEGDELQDARKRFEQARMTRRQALRKMGLTTGATIFSLLTIDDLARLSAKKLQEHEASRGIGDALAKEFRGAGVAFANPSGPLTPPPNPSGCSGCDTYCIPDADYDCVDCPPECATPLAGGGKKKRHKCSNSQGFWDACGGTGGTGYSNRLECCEAKCVDCCTATLRSCGGTAQSKYAIYSVCQEECVKLNGQ